MHNNVEEEGRPGNGITAQSRPLRVLLVEDSEEDATLLLRAQRRGGYVPRFERIYTPERMKRALSEADEQDEALELRIEGHVERTINREAFYWQLETTAAESRA